MSIIIIGGGSVSGSSSTSTSTTPTLPEIHGTGPNFPAIDTVLEGSTWIWNSDGNAYTLILDGASKIWVMD